MTPAARVAAAIDILDAVFAGDAAEKALSGWGRSHRFAGSKDRAAIRDHVFQALRCKASYGWLGGAETGRGVMLGAMRAAGTVDDIFTGDGYGPAPVTDGEAARDLKDADRATRLDAPDWLLPRFDAAFGPRTDDILSLLQTRAGVFLRVNTARTTRAKAQASLAEDSIKTTPVDGVNTALQVLENERRVVQSTAYKTGLVELQDPASQYAVLALEIAQGTTLLDFCAGGGGKALACAARGAHVTAHDVNVQRMKDIAPRADRAGAKITLADPAILDTYDPFDIVFCDAPCSGSGTWRRAPEAKWALTPERLEELTNLQTEVLNQAKRYVKSGGHFVYATCSVFEDENADQITRFLKENTYFELVEQHSILPSATTDGFFYTVLQRS